MSLSKYLIQNGRKMPKAKRHALDRDPRWDQSLEGFFNLVNTNERHLIKEKNTHISVSVQWSAVEFHIILAAKIIPNGLWDWPRYTAFQEQNTSEHWMGNNRGKAAERKEADSSNKSKCKFTDDVITILDVHEQVTRNSANGLDAKKIVFTQKAILNRSTDAYR